jgi:SAM-dependent methyltransferase
MLALYLRNETRFLAEPVRVLHFAPERCMERLLRANPGAAYLSGDLDGSRAMRAIDVTNIGLADGSFDLVLCSHVLEHVPDDRRAMREILRVLAPGGTAVLLVPIDRELACSDEDPSVTDPAERKRRFGQHDHVRQYGMDYYDRVREAGFTVQSIPYADAMDPTMRVRHGLQPGTTIDLGTKPADA